MRNEDLYARIGRRESLMAKVIKRKLGMFEHICQMRDDRKIKTLMLRMMDGENRRGRPSREWLDDVKLWCGNNSIAELSHWATDRNEWRIVVERASSTYGQWAHGS